jgi:hypothetical protein
MNRIQILAVKCSLLGSLLLIVMCLAVTAGVAPVEGAPDPTEDAAPVQAEPPSSECRVSDQFPESIRQWCGLITRYADQHGLSPDLIAALIWQESGGNPLAYSKSGAVGLMQVMPRDGIAANFTCPNGPCFASRPTIEELQAPEFNVEYGTRLLAGLSARLGSLRDALKAYGPKDVGYDYADKVLAIYERYRGE